jgi:hypothetical protein
MSDTEAAFHGISSKFDRTLSLLPASRLCYERRKIM